MEKHLVVPHEEWIEARKRFLAEEKEFTKARDRLSARRRELPWERVEKRYVFDGPAGRETLADLFDESVANGTPIRAVVGADPVEFAEAFLRNYPEGQWIGRERERLTNAIDRAADNKP